VVRLHLIIPLPLTLTLTLTLQDLTSWSERCPHMMAGQRVMRVERDKVRPTLGLGLGLRFSRFMCWIWLTKLLFVSNKKSLLANTVRRAY
jgi:hypothetical protein